MGNQPGPADAGIRRYLKLCDELQPGLAGNTGPVELRRQYEAMCDHFAVPHPIGITSTDDLVAGPAGDVPVRIYMSGDRQAGPAMLYLHGGGYILGSLDSHDSICADLAHAAGLAIVAVDYRLAPEHRFSAAFDDCATALAGLTRLGDKHGFDGSQVVIGGDSAGAALSAALCLKLRDDRRPMPRGQVLIYPGLGGDMGKGSYIEHANAPGMTTADLLDYVEAYLGPAGSPSHTDKRARPLAETDFGGLPPAFITVAEWDPLRDDGFDYADRLKAAGIAATVRHEPDLIHAYLRARHMSDAAGASFAAIARAVNMLAFKGTLPERDERS